MEQCSWARSATRKQRKTASRFDCTSCLAEEDSFEKVVLRISCASNAVIGSTNPWRSRVAEEWSQNTQLSILVALLPNRWQGSLAIFLQQEMEFRAQFVADRSHYYLRRHSARNWMPLKPNKADAMSALSAHLAVKVGFRTSAVRWKRWRSEILEFRECDRCKHILRYEHVCQPAYKWKRQHYKSHIRRRLRCTHVMLFSFSNLELALPLRNQPMTTCT